MVIVRDLIEYVDGELMRTSVVIEVPSVEWLSSDSCDVAR